jgi:lysophospholipase L1-like esterase
MKYLAALPLILAMAGPCNAAEVTAEEPIASTNTAVFRIPDIDAGIPGAGPIRRYDWFRQLWEQRRSAWAKQVQQDQHALVFLGDSITQGWGDDMGGYFAGMKVANRGISGDTSRGVLLRLKQDVLLLNPSGIVLLIGTNDLEEGADPATIASNVRLILDDIKAFNPRIPIILCQVFPSSESKKRPADKIRRLNELLMAAAKDDPQVTPIETWLLFANEKGDANEAEFPDLLHPNKLGYAKWAAALRPVLATYGFVENAPDNFMIEPGFTRLFNGKDLTGWGDGQKSFDKLRSSPDGRYVAKGGRLIVMNPPEGHKIEQLWTVRHFPRDFILKLEFRAGVNADSGIFIRKQQLQCRDYLLAGPYKDLKRYRPQDWNEILIMVRDGVAHCTCNGEVLDDEFPVPSTGPIGLEADHGQMEYRRIRFSEQP